MRFWTWVSRTFARKRSIEAQRERCEVIISRPSVNAAKSGRGRLHFCCPHLTNSDCDIRISPLQVCGIALLQPILPLIASREGPPRLLGALKLVPEFTVGPGTLRRQNGKAKTRRGLGRRRRASDAY